VIGTQTLAPGQQITASGTVLSMAPDGETLFLGDSSVLLGGGGSNAATATGEGNHWVVWKIALRVIGVGLFV
jgi:hypothetical protein